MHLSGPPDDLLDEGQFVDDWWGQDKRVGVVLAVAALCAAVAGFWLARELDSSAPPLASGTWLSIPRSLADFQLNDSDGHPFTKQNLLGQPSLVFFGFTHCPDLCPTTLVKLAQVKKTAPIAGMHVLFITVDPQRDTDQYVAFAAEQGLAIRYVILTHLHADFVAGHLELRDRCGAAICLGAAAKAGYAFTPLADGGTLDLGPGVRLKILETPGHTRESISVVVYDLAASGERPHAVLTGDTLFVGDVGRPDLRASLGWSERISGGRPILAVACCIRSQNTTA